MNRALALSRLSSSLHFKSSALFLLVLSMLLLPFRGQLLGQVMSGNFNVNADNMTPTPGGHDYIHLFGETVSPANGSVSYRINYPVPKGRGISYPNVHGYNSAGLYQLMFLMPQQTLNWVPNPLNYNGSFAHVTYQETTYPYMQQSCPGAPNQQVCAIWQCTYVNGFTFTDMNGVSHNLGFGAAAPPQGPPPPGTFAGQQPCGNGYVYPGGDGEVSAEFTNPSATISDIEGSNVCNTCVPSVNGPIGPYVITDKEGTTYFFGGGSYNSAAQIWVDSPYEIEDRNGNVICLGFTGYPCSGGWTDTAGRPLFNGGITYPTPTPPAGAPQSVPVNYTVPHQKTYSTAYGEVIQCPWATGDLTGQITGTQPAWAGIALPDNTQYQFFYGTYNPNDSTILNNFGLLNEVIYPGGGWIKYVWKIETNFNNATSIQNFAGKGLTSGNTDNGACALQYSVPRLYSRQVSYDGHTVAQTQIFKYTTTWPSNWVNGPTSQSTTVQTTDNVLNKTSQTIYTYYAGSSLEQMVQYYDWNNNATPIKTVYKSWANNAQPLCEVTVIDGKTSGRFYKYLGTGSGSYPNDYVTDVQEFDYGVISDPTVCGRQSTAGVAPTRETKTTYQSVQVPAGVVPSSGMGQIGAVFQKPKTVITYDVSGNKLAETDYAYDGATLTTSQSTIIQHDDGNYSASAISRGNVTSVTSQCFSNCSSPSPQTTYAYDTTGQVVSKIAPCGSGCPDITGSNAGNQTTSYSYIDKPSNTDWAVHSNAYVTQLTLPMTGSLNFTYDYDLGDLTTSKDQNGQITTYSYECSQAPCSALDRLTQTLSPDGGKTTISYNDWASVTTSQWITAAGNPKQSTTIMDGMFRTTQSQLNSDPDGADYTDTTLDAEGSVIAVSNPHRAGSSTTDGKTQTIADVLGRPLKITKQDGSYVTTLYNDPCIIATNAYGVTVTDEAGNHRRSCTDGLGRLLEVDEPGVANQLTSGSTTFYVSGGPGTSVNPCQNNQPPATTYCPVYNSGNIVIVVNGASVSASWSGYPSFTTSDLVSQLVSGFNATGFLSATPNGNSVVVRALQGGQNTNYSVSISGTWYTQYYSGPSYSVSGANFSGGNGYPFYSTAAFITLYNYDTLGNLLCVWQKGSDATAAPAFTYNPVTNSSNCLTAVPPSWRPRSFTYDSLSRLTSSTNPESGTISYSYDANGNLSSKTAPQPNQLATGVNETTTYNYDFVNRLLSKTYTGMTSPATVTVTYGYDGVAASGCTPPALSDSYPKARRTSMCDGAGSTSWSHDSMGRVAIEKRTTVGVTKSTSYTYNLDGSVASVTYPSGRTVNYGYYGVNNNSAGRVISVSDSSNSYVSNARYAPPGEPTFYNNGNNSAISNTNVFGPRLQPWYLSAKNSGGTPIMQLCYDFHSATAVSVAVDSRCAIPASTVGDNGNVSVIQNFRDPNRTQNFTYDALNRIQQAWTNGNSPLTTSWGETFTIDAWGNLTNMGPVGNKTYSEPLSAAPANSKNQLSGFCHDAAGNLILTSACPTGSFVTTYSYDAENRMVYNPGATYAYDGDGNRVQKVGSGTTLYWYGAAGDILTETDSSGGTVNDYVFFNGKRVARQDSSGNVHYYFSDHLGSTSLITDNVGTMSPRPQAESDYYPYGGEIVITADSTSNHYKFTGKERDAETCGIYCLDNFGKRYDASALGRFMTADFDGTSIKTNPQSLNLYAYTFNNPLRYVDPDGMAPVEIARYTVTFYRQVSEATNWLDALVGAASAFAGPRTENMPRKSYWPDVRPGSEGHEAPMSFPKPPENSVTGIVPDEAYFKTDFQAWTISVDFSGSGSGLRAKIGFDQGFVIGAQGPGYLAFRKLDMPTKEYGKFNFSGLNLLSPAQLKALSAEATRQLESTGDDRYREIQRAVEQAEENRAREEEKKCKTRARDSDESGRCRASVGQ